MPRRNTEDRIFLLHPTRRNIYKIICESPGTYFYRLMSEIPNHDKKVSSATLLYHLSRLEEDGLITSDKIDGKRIYYPKNLRTKEMEHAYMLLKNDNALKMFIYIINNLDCFQNELARALGLHHDSIRYHAVRLEKAGLIKRYKDGKKTRFQIGDIGKAILDGSLALFSESYVRFIISKLADDCHFPEVISQTRDELVIRVVCPGEDDIELSINISNWGLDSMSISEEEDKEDKEKIDNNKNKNPNGLDNKKESFDSSGDKKENSDSSKNKKENLNDHKSGKEI